MPTLWRAAFVLALLAVPAVAGAQQLRGVAMDPDGRPLPGTVVALHRVGGGVGGTVASVTTDDRGRFEFTVEAADSAVYFAAMRYQDRMYVGPAVHPGFRPVDDYVLRADPASEAGAVASAMQGGGIRTAPPVTPAQRSGGTDAGSPLLWAVVLLVLAMAAAMIGTVPRYRRRRTREALVELATLEERLAEGPAGEERDELARRRDSLMERLSPRP